MKHATKLTVLLTAAMMLSAPMQVFADETAQPADVPVSAAAAPEPDSPDATGLITSKSLSITAGRLKLMITAKTIGNAAMAEIGLKNIIVQYSPDGVSGWETDTTVANQIATNADKHTLDNFAVSVSGGAYYRVMLDHYAKEQRALLPGTQTLSNVSNVVYVPK